jgi:hypothetical protein
MQALASERGVNRIDAQEEPTFMSQNETQHRLWGLACFAAAANLALCLLLKRLRWSDLAYPAAMLQLSLAHLTSRDRSWIRSVAWVVMIVVMFTIVILGP